MLFIFWPGLFTTRQRAGGGCDSLSDSVVRVLTAARQCSAPLQRLFLSLWVLSTFLFHNPSNRTTQGSNSTILLLLLLLLSLLLLLLLSALRSVIFYFCFLRLDCFVVLLAASHQQEKKRPLPTRSLTSVLKKKTKKKNSITADQLSVWQSCCKRNCG